MIRLLASEERAKRQDLFGPLVIIRAFRAALFAATVLACGIAAAQDRPAPPVPAVDQRAANPADSQQAGAGTQSTGQAQPDSLQIILDQQHELAADLADGGIQGLTARENRKIGEAQVEVFAVTGDRTVMDALTIEEKVQLENALERINALVKNSREGAEDQNVCWREQKTGSHTTVTRCGTKAEIQQAREGARAWLSRPSICVPPGCGG